MLQKRVIILEYARNILQKKVHYSRYTCEEIFAAGQVRLVADAANPCLTGMKSSPRHKFSYCCGGFSWDELVPKNFQHNFNNWPCFGRKKVFDLEKISINLFNSQ